MWRRSRLSWPATRTVVRIIGSPCRLRLSLSGSFGTEHGGGLQAKQLLDGPISLSESVSEGLLREGLLREGLLREGLLPQDLSPACTEGLPHPDGLPIWGIRANVASSTRSSASRAA